MILSKYLPKKYFFINWRCRICGNIHILERLLVEGYNVSVIVRPSSDLWRIKHLKTSVKVFSICKDAEEIFKFM
jgi:hypothetical protein